MAKGTHRGTVVDDEPDEIILPEGKSWFVGIGINQYLHFTNLNNAVKDVEDVLEVVSRKYELDQECVMTLFDENANRENIITTFDQLVEKVQPVDKVLIYYSGHGHLNTKTEKGKFMFK